jgi:hypothetical protein
MESVVVVVEENVDVLGWGFSDLKIYPHHQHPYHHFPKIVSDLLVTLEIYCGCWVVHPGVEWGSDSFKPDYIITVMGGNLPPIMGGQSTNHVMSFWPSHIPSPEFEHVTFS